VFYIPTKFVDDRASGYSLDKTVVEACGSSVADLAAKVKAAIIEPLTTALEHESSTDAVAFRQNFASGQAMGVAFLGYENGAPAMVDLRFIIEDLSAAKLKLSSDEHHCPGADCHGGYAMVLIPEDLKAPTPLASERKSWFEAAHPSYWLADAAAVAANAEAFVRLAIDEKRVDIGPPVSVFVLDSREGRWLKPGMCAK
jgi:hypothetical protein